MALSNITKELRHGNNLIIIIICVSTPILQAFLTCFKKYRLRKEISISQRLRQTIFDGVSNLYGHVIVLVTLVVIFFGLLLHLWMVKIDKKEDKFEEHEKYEGVSPNSMVIYVCYC